MYVFFIFPNGTHCPKLLIVFLLYSSQFLSWFKFISQIFSPFPQTIGTGSPEGSTNCSPNICLAKTFSGWLCNICMPNMWMFWSIAITEHCDSLPLSQDIATASTCVSLLHSCFSGFVCPLCPHLECLFLLLCTQAFTVQSCGQVLSPAWSFSLCNPSFPLPGVFIAPVGLSARWAFQYMLPLSCGASPVLCPPMRQWELQGKDFPPPTADWHCT